MGNLLFYVPHDIENSVRLTHEKICHLGIDTTHEQIKKNYWFKNMKGKIEKFIKICGVLFVRLQ